MIPNHNHKIFIPPKIFIFLKTPEKYWNSNFWIPKIGPSLCMYENIRVPPPPLLYSPVWNMYMTKETNNKSCQNPLTEFSGPPHNNDNKRAVNGKHNSCCCQNGVLPKLLNLLITNVGKLQVIMVDFLVWTTLEMQLDTVSLVVRTPGGIFW